MMSRRDMKRIALRTRRRFRRAIRRQCYDHIADYIGRVHEMHAKLGIK